MGKKGSSFILIVSLLSSMVIQPAISVAISQNSEEPQQTEQSSGGLTTLSSDVLGNPNEPMVSEEEPANDEKEKDVFAEETYEARDLSKKDEDNASHPIVEVQMSQETLKGEIVLGSDPPNGTKTILKTIALQTKDESTEWQEVKVFEDGKDHVLNDSSFNFEFSDSLNDQDYRIISEYVIEETDEEQHVVRTFHKGQVLLDPVEPTEKGEELPKTKVGTDETQVAPTEPENDVVNKSSEFIGPRAVNDVVYNGTSNGISTYVKIHDIGTREASIEYKHQRHSNSASTYKRYVYWSTDVARMTFLCRGLTNADYLPANLWAELKAEGTNVMIPLKSTWDDGSATYGPAKMTNLEPNKTYYVWLFYENPIALSAEWQNPAGTTTIGAKYIPYPYRFTTEAAVPLSITTPTFTQGDATHNTIPMVGKTYTGEIFQTSGQGKVQVTSNDGTTVQDKVTNLGHTTTHGGTYNSAAVTGLTAGTRYKGRTALKDYGGNWKYSGWSSYFYTANTVNQPAAPTLNTPTASNNATAAVTATYNAGDVAAHPTAVEVQASTNNSAWSTLSTSSTPATTTPTINTGNKSVSFTLSKLNSKTKYYVRYRVRNASNVWSGYSTSREFTTGAMTLTLNTPTFTQTTATHNAIYMTGTTYTGDIFQTSGQGKVQVTPDDGTTIQDKVTNLTHTVSQGGNYHNITVPGLTPGTRYKGRVAIKDYGGTWRYSAWSSYFYTVNTVNQPTVTNLNTPTTSANATADITATYNAGDVAAHPSAVHIEVSTDNSTWTTPSTTSTPATTTPTINAGNKSVSFTLSKLNSRTKYYVRYRVRNASNVWSGYSTSRELTTKGVPLVISPPVFDQATATATSIQLKPGSYTGDISQTGNQGVVFSESYNSGTNDKDWTARVHNLQHTTTTNGTYSSTQITGLTPGTRYRGWVQIKNAEEVVVGPVGQPAGAENEYFYTKNALSSLSAPTLNTPVAEHGATAEFSVDYQAAGDHPDQPAAHPNNVKVYLSTDGVAFSEISSHQTSPSIDTFDIDMTNKKATVKIKNLTAGQTYHVKCSVVNQGGESEQTPARMFTTNPRQAGLYISDTPTFNFGVQSVNSIGTNARLSNTQGTTDFGIKMENVGISSNWSFAARLSSLRTQDGSNQELTGAQLSLGKQLQKTTDGTTWQDVTQDFEGLGETTAILPADHSTTQLWKSTDISAGQGKFRTAIAFDSVNLLIPGNTAQKGAFYEGKIEWLMVNEP
ncbi:hypothetical protein [Enterococcus sp. DIV0170]|uniref:hypothetical protein n=1 Tax=Enterococcus sp. DIV0170 TaxID=2774642 RepID=UPI003F260416